MLAGMYVDVLREFLFSYSLQIQDLEGINPTFLLL